MLRDDLTTYFTAIPTSLNCTSLFAKRNIVFPHKSSPERNFTDSGERDRRKKNAREVIIRHCNDSDWMKLKVYLTGFYFARNIYRKASCQSSAKFYEFTNKYGQLQGRWENNQEQTIFG